MVLFLYYHPVAPCFTPPHPSPVALCAICLMSTPLHPPGQLQCASYSAGRCEAPRGSRRAPRIPLGGVRLPGESAVTVCHWFLFLSCSERFQCVYVSIPVDELFIWREVLFIVGRHRLFHWPSLRAVSEQLIGICSYYHGAFHWAFRSDPFINSH